ncbi:DUF2314 domain-containing protein [Pseudomonas sp. NPDC090202]|uniref:DUF2314 domain-containing protein n=1 Tax=unclassified Pseudomonas TaxID=196821 RepID=UPI00381961DB
MNQQIIYNVEGESDDLKSAVASAQATFKFFWREQSWEARRIIKSLDVAAVKMSFALDSDDPQVPAIENMWVSDVEFDGQFISGILMNEPRWITSLKASDPVRLPFTALNDWMYVREGHVYGGFTVDALRSGMSASDRDEHDCAWGLSFGEPGTVELVPAGEGQKPWLFSRTLSGEADQQGLTALEHTEHPMALNMRDKVEDGLRQHPEAVRDFDTEGWLLLHREVLAGNYTVVHALLRHGADPLTLNSEGETALSLASHAGWPRILCLLEGSDPDYHGPIEPKGFPLWPIGLLLVVTALAWLYYLVIHPLRSAWAGHGVTIERPLDFLGAFFMLGFGIVSCTGPWYFRLRARTRQLGGSRVLDMVSMIGLVLIALVLHDQLQSYVIGLRH